MQSSSNISLAKAESTLNHYWGYDSFRPKQEEIIQTLFTHDAAIGLLPTGGGKSICYQVPALLLDGMTVVVSPLVSLMDDQVAALKKRNISAERIHSGLTRQSIDRILDNCVLGKVKLLYVSPERLHTELFLHRMDRCNIALIAIDEAHCISQWGHDFRPAYLNIYGFVEKYREAKLIALTASATPRVLKEIKSLLRIPEAKIIRDSFARPNLAIRISATDDKVNRLRKSVSKSSKTLIYCRSRRQVQMLAELIKLEGIPTAYYHAGLSYKDKKNILTNYTNGRLRCVIATNAFGMGIDIPDIRMVIHYDIPPSVEEYYQEIGRAGRDGKESNAMLLYQSADIEFHSKQLEVEFPDFEDLIDTYKRLSVHFGVHLHEGEGRVKSIDVISVAKQLQLKPKQLYGRLRSLSILGLIELGEQTSAIHMVKISQSARGLRTSIEYRSDPELIDLLMRTERIFEEWVSLPMEPIAKQLKFSVDQLHIRLQKLKSSSAIQYYHRASGPILTWMKNRPSIQEIRGLKQIYHEHKSRKEQRVTAINKLVDTDQCIMNTMLEYFGEWRDDTCGKCYNCQKNISKETDALDPEELIKYQRWAAEGYITLPEAWLRS